MESARSECLEDRKRVGGVGREDEDKMGEAPGKQRERCGVWAVMCIQTGMGLAGEVRLRRVQVSRDDAMFAHLSTIISANPIFDGTSTAPFPSLDSVVTCKERERN